MEIRKMHRLITLMLILFLPSVCIGTGNNENWLSFNKFVEASMEHNANQKSLIMLLNNPNPEDIEFGIRFSINKNKKLNAAPVFEAIWENNQKAFPTLNMQYLRQPTILLAIAGALSKIKHGHNKEQYEYVINQLNKNNPKTLPYAILALGYVGGKTDLTMLSKLAKKNDGEFLFQASFSILEIDYNTGMKVLNKIKNSFGLESNQAKLIDRIMKEYKPNNAAQSDAESCAPGL